MRFISLIFLYLTFLLFFIPVVAQQNNDQIEKELKKSIPDTARARLLIQFSENLMHNDAEEAIKYAKDALSLASTLKNNDYLADACLQVAYSYNYLNEFEKSDTFALKAKELYELIKNPQGISKALCCLGNNKINRTDYPKALELYNQAITYAEQSNYKKGLSAIYTNLGLIYDCVDNLDKALSYYNLALQIDSSINNKEGVALTYNNMGRLYAKKGENNKALLYYTKSYSIFSSIDNKQSMAYLMTNIGNMYFETSDYNKALEYYFNSIKIKKEISDTIGIANALNNIGVVYIKKEQLDSTLQYFKAAQNLYLKVKYKTGIANSYGNIGEIYFMQGKNGEAIDYFYKSIDLRRKISDLSGASKSYLGLGKIYNSIGKIDSAITNFNKSLYFANISSDKKTRLECLKQIAETEANRVNYFKAYKTYKQYILCYDSISNEQAKRELLDIQVKYETDNKDKEISLLNNENQTKIQKIKNQRYLIFISIFFFLIVAVFAIIYYRLFRKNKKTNQVLSEQNVKIEMQKEEITQQRDSLENLNSELEKQKDYILKQHIIIEKELKETLLKSEILQRENLSFQFEALKNQLNPHFLFNTFSTLISLIPDNPALAEKYTRHLSSVYRYILTSKDKELAKLSDELEFINSYMFLVSIRFDNSVKLEIKVENSQLSKYLPLLSLQLLIENAIKHNIISNRKTLFISIMAEDDILTVSNNLQKKSSVENSTNIGIQNIANRYQFLSKRQIKITQTPFEFIVKLPLLDENNKL